MVIERRSKGETLLSNGNGAFCRIRYEHDGKTVIYAIFTHQDDGLYAPTLSVVKGEPKLSFNKLVMCDRSTVPKIFQCTNELLNFYDEVLEFMPQEKEWRQGTVWK